MQVEGVRDLRELALPVGASAAEVALDHDVVPVDRARGQRRDVDDPRRRALPHEGEEQVGEQEGRQVVHLEAELVAVLADEALVRSRPDARVVDQHVQAVVVAQDRLGELAHLGEGGEVGPVEAGAPSVALDLPHDLVAALDAASVHDHVPPVGGEAVRDGAAQPTRRSRHEHDPLSLRGP